MSVFVDMEFSIGLKQKSVGVFSPQRILGQETASLAEALIQYKNFPPVPLIIPGVKEASFGFVFGPSKSGKTIYCESLLLSIAAGRTEFNGYPLQCNNRKCLFISYEENPRGRYDRNIRQLEDFTAEEQRLISQRYFVSTEQMPKYVLDEKDWKILEQRVAYHNPGVVVIDSLSRLTMENNSDEETGKRISKKLREIVVKYQCTIIVINHTTKGSNESLLTINSMSGSRIYLQEADFMIGINKSINNTRYIKLVCARYDADDSETVDTFEITANLSIKLKEKAYEAKILAGADGRHDARNYEIVFQRLVELTADAENNEVQAKDLKSLYEGQGRVMSKQTLFDVLKKLCTEGKLTKSGKGKYEYLK